MTEIWRKGEINVEQDIANMPLLLFYLSLKNVCSQTTSCTDKTELELMLTFTRYTHTPDISRRKSGNVNKTKILDFGCQT